MVEGDIDNQYILPKSKNSEVTSSIKTSTTRGQPAMQRIKEYSDSRRAELLSQGMSSAFSQGSKSNWGK